MVRAYLLIVGLGLVPIALSYGVDPAGVLPKFMNLRVEGTDLTQIFRAVMCLYLGMSVFCCIAAFEPAWQRVAVVWAVIFMLSLALGRVISLAVDGVPSRVLNLYLGVELVMGLLGLWLLARDPHLQGARR
jgi:hypothetical protein